MHPLVKLHALPLGCCYLRTCEFAAFFDIPDHGVFEQRTMAVELGPKLGFELKRAKDFKNILSVGEIGRGRFDCAAKRLETR